jgi:hypothetical protein
VIEISVQGRGEEREEGEEKHFSEKGYTRYAGEIYISVKGKGHTDGQSQLGSKDLEGAPQ